MIKPEEYGDKILRFLREWLEWAESGGPPTPDTVFLRGEGLCPNFRRYCRAHVHPEHHLRAARELMVMLEFKSFPFGGYNRYLKEREDKNAYLNTQRRAWAGEAIKELSKGN